MSTRSRAAIAFVALLLCSADTIADGIKNPNTQFIGNMGEGASNPGGAAGPPPVDCGTGVIDFSTGCVQPMFGGL